MSERRVLGRAQGSPGWVASDTPILAGSLCTSQHPQRQLTSRRAPSTSDAPPIVGGDAEPAARLQAQPPLCDERMAPSYRPIPPTRTHRAEPRHTDAHGVHPAGNPAPPEHSSCGERRLRLS